MSADPEFLTVDDVLQIHEEQLLAYGGATGIRDRGLLESAVAMPQASFGETFLHQGLSHMAAAYAFHLAQNQPFIDGNKRTGLVAALVFLELNGITILDPDELLYGAMIAIAERRIDKEGLAALLRTLEAPGTTS
jgi:death-on-curing protein